MAKTPKPKPASQVPEELQAVTGSHVFVSREREVTQFEFDGLRPALLMDGRLAWQTTEKHANSLMNHHFITGQRILYAGEGDNAPHSPEAADQTTTDQVTDDGTAVTNDGTEVITDGTEVTTDGTEVVDGGDVDQTSGQTTEG